MNEPASWTINEVSNSVGTPSVSGVAVGEDWAVIAGRAGMYLFDGGEPVKISQEIQPLWDQINWAAGQTLWVSVDTRNKRILCGVPTGTATSPNLILMIDYRSLSSGGEIAGARVDPVFHFVWKIVCGGTLAQMVLRGTSPRIRCTLAERSDGTSQLFLGNGLVGGARERENLSAVRRSIFGRRRGDQFLLHDLLFSEPRSRADVPGALAPQTFCVFDDVCGRGRELEPLRVCRQRGVSRGTGDAAAFFARRRKIWRCPLICWESAWRFRWGRMRSARGSSWSDLFRRCCRIRGRPCAAGIRV